MCGWLKGSGLLIAALTLLCAPAAAERELDVEGRVLTIQAGKAEVLTLRRDAADVLISNAQIADVHLPAPRRLYVLGRSIGSATIFVFDLDGDVISRTDVQVTIDDALLDRTLQQMFPGERVDIATLNQDIMLSGTVSSPEVAERIRLIARRFVGEDVNLLDLMKVQGDYQVLLKVRVYEVKRELLKELGFNTESYFGDGNFNASTQLLGGLRAGDTGNNFARASQPGSVFDPLMRDVTGLLGTGMRWVGDDGDALLIGLEALQRTGESRLLAEPNLTAISGERATFHAGSEYFVPVGESDGEIRFESRDLGVKLTFEPLVLSSERLRLHLATEVADLADENRQDTISAVIQGRNLRRAETTVEMKSGGSLMIAGLLQSELVDADTGLPIASDIPLLSEIGSTKSYQVLETELLVLVTAVLVRPHAGNGLALRTQTPDYPARAPVDDLMRFRPQDQSNGISVRQEQPGGELPPVSAAPLPPLAAQPAPLPPLAVQPASLPPLAAQPAPPPLAAQPAPRPLAARPAGAAGSTGAGVAVTDPLGGSRLDPALAMDGLGNGDDPNDGLADAQGSWGQPVPVSLPAGGLGGRMIVD